MFLCVGGGDARLQQRRTKQKLCVSRQVAAAETVEKVAVNVLTYRRATRAWGDPALSCTASRGGGQALRPCPLLVERGLNVRVRVAVQTRDVLVKLVVGGPVEPLVEATDEAAAHGRGKLPLAALGVGDKVVMSEPDRE